MITTKLEILNSSKSLDVLVRMGSAFKWLVTQYIVQCAYKTANGIQYCGTGTFDAEGGTIEGKIFGDNGSFPSSITVNVGVDFEPITNLHPLQKIFDVPVTDGVVFIFEPLNQSIQKTTVYLDLPRDPKDGDYIILEWWHYNKENNIVASGQKYTSDADLDADTITQYDIVFVPDQITARDIKIQIGGRYRNKVLPQFNQIYEITDKAILIRAEKQSGEDYMLVSG